MTGRLLAYAQLVRLPNVFTAFADILMAACVFGAISNNLSRVAILLFASSCLYLGGMVWNDIFDRHADARTRPSRPLPSGRIAVRTAVILGSILLATGVLVTIPLYRQGTKEVIYLNTPLVAIVLAVLILLYNAWLKRTPFGPLAMGGCRFFNVLLGLSAGAVNSIELEYSVAGIIGLYIVGVTWFARTEEGTSQKTHLLAAFGVMIAALLLALAVPMHLAEGSVTPLYPYLLVAFGFWIGLPIVNAIQRPTPKPVQIAVKRCILGLVLLDAILATAFIGPAGLLIGLLLLPAMWLGKWVYST